MEKSLKPDERYEIYFLANYQIALGISVLTLGAGILGIVLSLYQLIFWTGVTASTVIGTVLAFCFGSLLLLETKTVYSLFLQKELNIEELCTPYLLNGKKLKRLNLEYVGDLSMC